MTVSTITLPYRIYSFKVSPIHLLLQQQLFLKYLFRTAIPFVIQIGQLFDIRFNPVDFHGSMRTYHYNPTFILQLLNQFQLFIINAATLAEHHSQTRIFLINEMRYLDIPSLLR